MATPDVVHRRLAFGGLALVALIAGCAGGFRGRPVVSPELKTASTALAPDPDTRLARNLMPLAKANPGRSGFYVLRNGIEALAARLLLAERAERSIDVQYYLLHADLTGYVFVEHLLRAADRGVRVRVLLDDITTKGHDPGLAALDAHPNIEVRIFNPFSRGVGRWWSFLTDFGRVNHRMHNKSMTFDNQATIAGGRNIGDEYFDARGDTNYNDLELFSVGPVVQEVSQEFDTYWNSAVVVPIQALVGSPPPQDLERLRTFLAARADEARRTTYKAAFESSLSELFAFRADDLTWAPWTLVFDPPEKAEPGFARHAEQVNAQLRPIADSAQTELVMVSPYFVPRDRGVDWLRTLRQRGVRVVIVTNSLGSTDVLPVHAGYSSSRKALLEAGVELWEIREDPIRRDRQKRGLGFSASGLHAKAFAVDRRQLFVGSFNLDPRSADINTEMGIVVDAPSLAGPVVDRLLTVLPTDGYRLRLDSDGDIEWVAQGVGAEVVYRTEPHTGFWRRFKVGVLRLLPIEGQL